MLLARNSPAGKQVAMTIAKITWLKSLKPGMRGSHR